MVPPLAGVGVNVTEVPAQILLSASLDAIVTDGVTCASTVVVIPDEVAVVVEAHKALEVNTTVTASLFASVVVVYVAAVDTLLPFNFH